MNGHATVVASSNADCCDGTPSYHIVNVRRFLESVAKTNCFRYKQVQQVYSYLLLSFTSKHYPSPMIDDIHLVFQLPFPIECIDLKLSTERCLAEKRDCNSSISSSESNSDSNDSSK